ncbi:50S ribosomal protein L27, partial [Salmonella enterica subsp. enterica serovar Rochdale]|uniref:50S ribosomal protein L27 n=1 Tax=Salmonella enterica TaxID=28901 RepID=UPI003F89A921
MNVHGFGQTSHQHTDVEQKDNGNDHRADGRRIADAGCGPGADVKTKFHAGTNVGCGRDHTLFAKADGKVKFEVKGPKNRKYISIVA